MDGVRACSRRDLLATAAVGLAWLLAGCGTTKPPEPLGAPVDLGFLHDGATRKDECLLRLGPPSKTIATKTGGEVLTYWVGRDKDGLRAVASWESFEPVRYSLVLSFDAQGVLARHAMVKIWER